MRLLEILAGQDLAFTKYFDENEIPPYAVLSHTWGADGEEVTHRDIVDGTGRCKAGYGKLAFCSEQALRDEQSHFWVDTCCIDKSNAAELNTAIVSMFRWYAMATKCYVYLDDVSSTLSETDNTGNHDATWQSEFRSCRWLTRGWTLVDLLAPKVVEFYDRTGRKLGDKTTLERHICEATGIPAVALRGRALSSFSVEEKFSWQWGRSTKKPEDQAYSLSGICGVSMVPIYGEGRDRAIARLRKEINDVGTTSAREGREQASQGNQTTFRPASRMSSAAKSPTVSSVRSSALGVGEEGVHTHNDVANSCSSSDQPNCRFQVLSDLATTSERPTKLHIFAISLQWQHVRFCYIVVALGISIIGGSLAVGLYYSIAQDRMGDGFTAASWMIAVGTLVLAAPIAKHYPHCECWE